MSFGKLLYFIFEVIIIHRIRQVDVYIIHYIAAVVGKDDRLEENNAAIGKYDELLTKFIMDNTTIPVILADDSGNVVDYVNMARQ